MSSPLLEAYRIAEFDQTFKRFEAALHRAEIYAEEAHGAQTPENRAKAENEYNLAFDQVEIELRRMSFLSAQWGIDMQPILDAIDNWMTREE
jgi:hypothetical protein